MQFSYTEPLERGYAHMKRMLFEPFDIGKWFALGFTCFLAQLLDGGGGGGGSNWSGIGDMTEDSEAATLSGWEMPEIFPETGWAVGCGALIIGLIIVVIALVLLALWLSSRGRFMFLDNVIHDRAEVRKPWNEFREVGNSLFLWRLGFFFAVLALIGLTIAPLIWGIFLVANDNSSNLAWPLIILGTIAVIVAAIAISYVDMFLKHFVVPIMHREGLRTNAAWSRFLPILKDNLGRFLLYGLFLMALWIGIFIALVLVVLFTCCIALIPLIIPYISTVVLLPIYVTLRAFSLEFLQQMMPSIGLAGPEPEEPGPPPAELPAPA